jgi:sensor histidine kinase YesM
MLRLALDTVTEQEVPLSQELKYFDCYLDIEKIRFGNRLEVKRDIGPELQAALVPTFMLQPLVENAIKYGIERNPGPGTIEVSAEKAGDMLRLSVRDTGAGLGTTGETIEPKGIGLANTRARLQTLYPGQHRFGLRNATGGGCIAEVEIPFHAETWLTAPLPKES